MLPDAPVLSPCGLRHFAALRTEAVDAVTARFYAEHASIYAQWGDAGRDACREDLGFHLEFLRSVLEFGLLAPMVDYLRWLSGVLTAREIPVEHLPQSLDWLAEFFVARMEPEEGPLVAAALFAAKVAFLPSDGSLTAGYSARLPAAWHDCEAFESALLAGERHAAAAFIERHMAAGHGLVEVELHLIQPSLYRIGLKWQRNQVSVAQEHLATAIAQSLMVEGLMRSSPAAPNGRKLLLACIEGNHHAVGLQMVADAFQLAGWNVNLLGANLPSSALVRHAVEWKPHLLGLSIAFPQQLRVVKDVLARMTRAVGAKRPPLIIGGLAINNFDQLADHIGADAWSPNAAMAVLSGNRLAGAPVAR
jgi:methanogenic corrinoid protein MtbC1